MVSVLVGSNINDCSITIKCKLSKYLEKNGTILDGVHWRLDSNRVRSSRDKHTLTKVVLANEVHVPEVRAAFCRVYERGGLVLQPTTNRFQSIEHPGKVPEKEPVRMQVNRDVTMILAGLKHMQRINLYCIFQRLEMGEVGMPVASKMMMMGPVDINEGSVVIRVKAVKDGLSNSEWRVYLLQKNTELLLRIICCVRDIIQRTTKRIASVDVTEARRELEEQKAATLLAILLCAIMIDQF